MRYQVILSCLHTAVLCFVLKEDPSEKKLLNLATKAFGSSVSAAYRWPSEQFQLNAKHMLFYLLQLSNALR